MMNEQRELSGAAGSWSRVPLSNVMLHSEDHPARLIASRNYEALRAVQLLPGYSLVEWRKPAGKIVNSFTRRSCHSICLNLAGGEGTTRLTSNAVMQAGSAGNVSVFWKDKEYFWESSKPQHFVTFYFDDFAFHRSVLENFGVVPRVFTFKEIFSLRNDFIRNIFLNVILPLNWNIQSKHLIIQHALHLILARVVADYTDIHQQLAQREPQSSIGKIDEILAFINLNLNKIRTLEQVAVVFDCRSEELTLLFKEALGTTPGAYLLRQKLSRACYLLRWTDLPVSQVAARCGFHSVSNFSTRFKAVMNCTPLRFRSAVPTGGGDNRLVYGSSFAGP